MTDKNSPFATVEEAVEEIRQGRMIVLVDDEDRDNEGDLQLMWARLEVSRENMPAAAQRFDRAIAAYEKDMEAPTPGAAWALAETLGYAAAAFPASARPRRERILAVWEDQDRRYPGHPYLRNQVAAALAALEHSRFTARELALAATGGSLLKRIRRILESPERPRVGFAPLASALAGKKRFPGLLSMFSRLGEQTGKLPIMLDRAAKQLGAEVQRRAMQAATILEPLLIVAMGGVVMLIVLAVLLPIIQLNTWVK